MMLLLPAYTFSTHKPSIHTCSTCTFYSHPQAPHFSHTQYLTHLTQAIAEKKNKDSNKRVRIEKDDLEHMLFKLFEKTPYWTIQQLQKQLEQPTSYLKEVLTEIAVVNKKGPYKVSTLCFFLGGDVRDVVLGCDGGCARVLGWARVVMGLDDGWVSWTG